MTYIIRINLMLGGMNAYVEDVDSSTWVQTFNPNRAIVFHSKKDARKWISQFITSVESLTEIVEAKAEYLAFDKWIDGGYQRCIMQKPTDRNVPYDKNKHTDTDILNQRIYMRMNDGMVAYRNYATWPDLYSAFKHLWGVECYFPSNSDEDGLLLSFQIYARRDSSFGDFKKEFDLIVDSITFVDADGYKVISIFDHHLSEHGDSCSLLYKSDDDCRVVGRYIWDKDESMTLEKAFEFIRRERYYE